MPSLKTLVNGYPGSGKSYFLLTHPKIAWMLTEPGSEVLLDTHPHLKKNIAEGYPKMYVPSPEEDIKDTFKRLDEDITLAFKELKEGKIETLGFDNMTYLAENRWIYINQYEPSWGKDKDTGKLVKDSRGMYGTLGRWLYQFALLNLLSFKGNVVLTCQEMEEEMQNEKGQAVKTGRTVPNILGGFRDKVDGMVSASIYLFRKDATVGTTKGYKFMAQCSEGRGRRAKNRYGLPYVLEDISYNKIIESINKVRKGS